MFRSPSSALLVLAACGGTQRPATVRCSIETKVAVASQDELDALATCTELDSLTIRSGAPLDLAPLAKLERIRHDLVVGPTLALDHVAFPALREVGATLRIQSNSSVRGIFLPALVQVERFGIEANTALTSVSAPRLTRVTIALAVDGNGELEVADFSRLATIGETLTIRDNPLLTTLELPALITAPHRTVEGNRALGDLQPPVPPESAGDHE